MAKGKVPGNFDKVSGSVAKGYEKKGKSPEEAERIGDAVAAKVGREKFGAAGMAKKAAAGRKKASK